MFFKLVYYDIKNAFLQEWKKLLVVPVGFAVICVAFYAAYVTKDNGIRGTFGDFWLYIFGGMKEYIFDSNDKKAFTFPVVWTIVFLFMLYITLYYPYNDLLGYGQNVLTRSGGRLNWWLSKCLWNFATVLGFFLVGAVTVVVFSAVFGTLSTDISEDMYTEVFELGKYDGETFQGINLIVDTTPIVWPHYINIELFLMPFLTAVVISQLQMLLSLWMRPVFSFCAMVGVLVVSAYYVRPFMIGNYAMATRFDKVLSGLDGNSVSVTTGIIILSALFVACVVAGAITFRHYDILNKEN